MLGGVFSMVPSRVFRALLALGAVGLPGCGPGAAPETVPEAVATARALVRPYVARNALTATLPGSAPQGAVTPGPTAVVLGRRATDGTLRVGCVDSEDGAEALVRDSEDSR